MNNTLHKDLSLCKDFINTKYDKKTVVYQLVNLVNNKTYVGSSVDLKRRFNEYLNPLYIQRNLKKGNSIVMNALLKYGYTNFGIRILEVCDLPQDLSKAEIQKLILQKEQYYLDLIKPDYNINQTAGSNLGRVYSEEVRNKMSLAKIGKVGNKKGAILSAETRAYFREKSGMATPINMCNEKMEVLSTFKSIQIASEITGISRSRISKCLTGVRRQVIENGNTYIFEYANKQ